MPPPPGPDGVSLTSRVIWIGTVATVEENLDRSWAVRKLIDWGMVDVSSPGGLTPLHRVTLSNAVRTEAGPAQPQPQFEMSGCSIKIPVVGQRAIFFVSKTDPASQPLPLYDSDQQLFDAWLRVLTPLVTSAPAAEAR